jgi:hypothetical protein
MQCSSPSAVPAQVSRTIGAMAAGALLLLASPARAQDELTLPPQQPARRGVEAGQLLPDTVGANVSGGRATVVASTGYDSARGSATFGATADLRVWGPVAVRVGATYLPSPVASSNAARMQPNFGVRVQLLDQRRHGIDGAVGLTLRKDRYTQDDGEMQLTLMASRRSGRMGYFVNAAYGTDDEGDDRDGTVSLGALYSAGEYLQLGLDSRLRFDLFSTDRRRDQRGETSYDLVVGPTAAVPLGTMALIAQVGYAAVKARAFSSGVVALAGVGTSF